MDEKKINENIIKMLNNQIINENNLNNQKKHSRGCSSAFATLERINEKEKEIILKKKYSMFDLTNEKRKEIAPFNFQILDDNKTSEYLTNEKRKIIAPFNDPDVIRSINEEKSNRNEYYQEQKSYLNIDEKKLDEIAPFRNQKNINKLSHLSEDESLGPRRYISKDTECVTPSDVQVDSESM